MRNSTIGVEVMPRHQPGSGRYGFDAARLAQELGAVGEPAMSQPDEYRTTQAAIDAALTMIRMGGPPSQRNAPLRVAVAMAVRLMRGELPNAPELGLYPGINLDVLRRLTSLTQVTNTMPGYPEIDEVIRGAVLLYMAAYLFLDVDMPPYLATFYRASVQEAVLAQALAAAYERGLH